MTTMAMTGTTTAIATGAADAQVGRPPCAPRPLVLARIAEDRGQTRRGIGMHASGRVVEVFAGEGGGWTVIATDPHGRSCVVAAGRGWEDLREVPPPPGEPA